MSLASTILSLTLAWGGADVSMLPALESRGAVYRDATGQPADALRVLFDHGCRQFRVRLFVDPSEDFNSTWGAVQDLEQVRDLCKRIHALGGEILLDLHYSDTWADPKQQTMPKQWAGLSFDQLVSEVHRYTAGTLSILREAGITPSAVQIGNEIAGGMLWPMGKIKGDPGSPEREASLRRLAALLNAGARAVRQASTPEHPIRVVVHVHGGGKRDVAPWFFGEMIRLGVDFDIAAVSFYPRWDEDLDVLHESVRHLTETLDRDVMLAEVGYPARDLGRWIESPQAMRWPQSPEGQAAFLDDINRFVQSHPRCVGWYWWYPEAVPVEGVHLYEGGASALFDEEGKPRPAMTRFRP